MAFFQNSRSFPGPQSFSRTFQGLCKPCEITKCKNPNQKTDYFENDLSGEMKESGIIGQKCPMHNGCVCY